MRFIDRVLQYWRARKARRWIPAGEGPFIAVDDPATGEIIGAVPRLGRAETREAIDAAASACTRIGLALACAK